MMNVSARRIKKKFLQAAAFGAYIHYRNESMCVCGRERERERADDNSNENNNNTRTTAKKKHQIHVHTHTHRDKIIPRISYIHWISLSLNFSCRFFV